MLWPKNPAKREKKLHKENNERSCTQNLSSKVTKSGIQYTNKIEIEVGEENNFSDRDSVTSSYAVQKRKVCLFLGTIGQGKTVSGTYDADHGDLLPCTVSSRYDVYLWALFQSWQQ